MRQRLARISITSLLLFSLFTGVFNTAEASPVPAPASPGSFEPGADAYTAYAYAPPIIRDLVSWTQGAVVSGHGRAPQGVNWEGGRWADNLLANGPLFDPGLDWAAAVDNIPEAGALVVWPGGSTSAYSARGKALQFTFGPEGHVAYVNGYDPAAKTLEVLERSWEQPRQEEKLRGEGDAGDEIHPHPAPAAEKRRRGCVRRQPAGGRV